MKHSLLLLTLAALFFTSCESEPSEIKDDVVISDTESADSIITSFVFVGCNRLWWKDVQPETSSANTDVLKNIFTHVANSGKKTDFFFYLGDIVNGEADVKTLESQLYHWNKDYNNGVFSDFESTGITLIAVPGNHEMLDQNEKPLEGTTETWIKHMGKYMPDNRDSIPNSPDDRATYGFTHGNIGFIVLNTDTYNTNEKESVIPYDWVKNQVKKYHADPAIEHIFVMGHRPFYVGCDRDTTHQGMRDAAQSTPVWQSFEDNDVASMLSAHVHQYQRMQPNQKTYQLIAGNGGSPVYHRTPPKFFGYTRINVWASGRIEMISEGYDAPAVYADPVPHPKWSVRDSLFDMNWYRKGAPVGGKCELCTGE